MILLGSGPQRQYCQGITVAGRGSVSSSHGPDRMQIWESAALSCQGKLSSWGSTARTALGQGLGPHHKEVLPRLWSQGREDAPNQQLKLLHSDLMQK